MVEGKSEFNNIYEELLSTYIENKTDSSKGKIEIQSLLSQPGIKSKNINLEKLKKIVESDPKKLAIEDEKGSSFLVFLDENDLKKNSPFDYLLILDFEAQCDDNQKLKCQEIIEFPVLLLNTTTLEVEKDYFHTYVKPDVYPVLFPFCTELTGIQQSQVDEGAKLSEVIIKLQQFLKDKGVFDKSYTFATCGFWDLNTCLKNEARFKKLEVPLFLRSFINVKQVFANDYLKDEKSIKSLAMPTMLNILKLNLEGRHHSGIDDCRNIAKICIELLRKGVTFKRSFKNFVKY